MSLGKPIQRRGQSSRSLLYAASGACRTGGEWFTVEVFALEAFFALRLITILNQCHHFRGFVYEGARFSRGERTSREVQVRPRR
jgi:hypothetical protein